MQKRGISRRLFTLFAALSSFVFTISSVNLLSVKVRGWCSNLPSVNLDEDEDAERDWGIFFDERGAGVLLLTPVKPHVFGPSYQLTSGGPVNPKYIGWSASFGGKNHEGLGFRFARASTIIVHGVYSEGPALVARQSLIRLPYWFIIPVSAIAPALWLRRALKERRTRQRLQSGCCVNCGYDLRASPGRCPECGAMACKR